MFKNSWKKTNSNWRIYIITIAIIPTITRQNRKNAILITANLNNLLSRITKSLTKRQCNKIRARIENLIASRVNENVPDLVRIVAFIGDKIEKIRVDYSRITRVYK